MRGRPPPGGRGCHGCARSMSVRLLPPVYPAVMPLYMMPLYTFPPSWGHPTAPAPHGCGNCRRRKMLIHTHLGGDPSSSASTRRSRLMMRSSPPLLDPLLP